MQHLSVFDQNNRNSITLRRLDHWDRVSEEPRLCSGDTDCCRVSIKIMIRKICICACRTNELHLQVIVRSSNAAALTRIQLNKATFAGVNSSSKSREKSVTPWFCRPIKWRGFRCALVSPWDRERRAARAPNIVDAESNSDTLKIIKTRTFRFKATFAFPFFFPLFKVTRLSNGNYRTSGAQATHRRTKKPVCARDLPSTPVSYESCGRGECARSRPAGERGSGGVPAVC